ncbi:hypothetical protein DMI70_24310 [Escherichia coli]|nr:hypothetical protein [Escherichia coli]
MAGGRPKAFKQVAPDFFDLIVIDECHRGSASEDSARRDHDYFSSATQIGLTATPKRRMKSPARITSAIRFTSTH